MQDIRRSRAIARARSDSLVSGTMVSFLAGALALIAWCAVSL
jgi:hypothetical protein